MSQRTAVLFYYSSTAVLMLLELSIIKCWVVNDDVQLMKIRQQHGEFRTFGLPHPLDSSEPSLELSGAAVVPLMRGLLTLWAARSQVPLLPPHRFLRMGVVWTEVISPSVRFAIVVTHTEALSQLAIVFTRPQLRELVQRSYHGNHRVFDAIQSTAQLPGVLQVDTPGIFVVTGEIAKDLIHGLLMAKELPLPRGA